MNTLFKQVLRLLYKVNFHLWPYEVEKYHNKILFFFSLAVKIYVLQVNMGSSVRRDVHVRMEECVIMCLESAPVLQDGW